MKKLSSRFLSTDEWTTERVTIHNRVLFGVERKELFDKHGRLKAVEQVSHGLSNAVEFLRCQLLRPTKSTDRENKMVVVILGGFYRCGVPTGDNEKLVEMVNGNNIYSVPFIYMLKPDYSSKFYVIFYRSGKWGWRRKRRKKGFKGERLRVSLKDVKLIALPPCPFPYQESLTLQFGPVPWFPS